MWRTQVFGNENPSSMRVAGTLVLCALLVLAMHGLFVLTASGSFLPAATWYAPGAVTGFLLAGAAIGLLVFAVVPANPRVPRHSLRHFVLSLLAVPMVAGLGWLA